MKIDVKLGGRLKACLPPEKKGSSQLSLPTGSKVSEAITQLRIAEDIDELLVIIDEENVPPGQRATYVLKEGQLLTVMPPLKGG